MIAIHLYYDGCNGIRQGNDYEGTVEELAVEAINEAETTTTP